MPEKLTVNTDKPVRVEMQRHWSDWLKPIVTIAGFLLVAFVLLTPGGFTDSGAPYEVTLDEWFVERDPVAAGEETDEIGLVDLRGMIVSQDVAENELADQAAITPDDVRDALSYFHPEDGFKAVVIRLTTPGGMVTASDEIGRIVQQYSKDVLPVYVYADDLMASGGYYVAVAADKIYAHKLATVGSIGVIYEIPNIEVLAKDKLGIALEVYKTGPYKDMNNPFRQRTADEKRMIDADLQENLTAFIDAIAAGRGMPAAEVRKFATGQVWSGQKAAELKLIDKVLYDDELAAELRTQLKTDREIAYVRYDAAPSLLDEVLDSLAVFSGRSPTEAVDRFISPARAGSYYLFRR